MRECGKILYSWAGHRWQYGSCTLHAGYLRLQIHTLILIPIAFPLQQWLHKCTSVLCHMYIACLVFFLMIFVIFLKRETKGLCRQTAHLGFKVQYLAVLSEIQRITLCYVLTGHKKNVHMQLYSNIQCFNCSW